ncbi:hypothetical protein ANN_27202 [Periplaneta americana]|uniref:Uncharacterized protein n=1 Tax=Periplaneta americana TaxID=6978 RepID=A0ABQ8RXD3_PERAM|nr:hypothetical protein ANN_27202 [Periplaneta americana]
MKLGKMLFDSNIPNIQVLKPAGRNKFEIHFTNYFQFLISDFDSKYNCSTLIIPYYHIHCKGILKNIAKDIDMDDIVKFGTYNDNTTITHAYRFNQKEIDQGERVWMPSTTVLVTFWSQLLPKDVKLFYTIHTVQKYNNKVLQCRNCNKFGHSPKFCHNTATCMKCASEHSVRECTSSHEMHNEKLFRLNYDEPDSLQTLKLVYIRTTFCCIRPYSGDVLNCTLQHMSNNPECPKYKTELSILQKMADLKVSRYDAIAIYQGRRTFAEVTSQHLKTWNNP